MAVAIDPHPEIPPLDEWSDDAVPRLFGYFIVRVGGRTALAEDLTQETMLAAIGASNGPHRSTETMAWLFGIARHKLIDHYRREERDRHHFGAPVEPSVLDITPAEPLGDLDLDAVHTRDDIVATLDRLPPRQRTVLVLRYFDDLDVQTTANLLGLSLHATESLLSRARKSFRRIYRDITGELS